MLFSGQTFGEFPNGEPYITLVYRKKRDDWEPALYLQKEEAAELINYFFKIKKN
jgi:hypothetical protein